MLHKMSRHKVRFRTWYGLVLSPVMVGGIPLKKATRAMFLHCGAETFHLETVISSHVSVIKSPW